VSKVERALVLTAGLGTRLRPLTDVRAKPAIPVAGDALVRRIIRWLADSGVRKLVLNLHHRPETVTAEVGDGSDVGAAVRYSWEQPVLLGSAGGPRRALRLLEADTFLIVNGDTLSDVNIAELAADHASSGAVVTLALVPNREFERYGGVELDEEGRVRAFVPRGPGARGSYHFIGVQVAHRSVFESLPDNQPVNSIGGVYDALLGRGAVRGFVCDARFFDVGTPADYWHTVRSFAGAGSTIGANVEIDRSARVVDSILWDYVSVAAGAVLDECIVADRVTIPAGASYRRTILTRGADGRLIAAPLVL